MFARTDQSLLVLSIDVEARSQATSLEHQREIRSVAREMIRLFDKHQISATWAVSDPGADWAISELCGSNLPHELALQGNAIWRQRPISRVDFAGKLHSRLGNASRKDVHVRSIVGLEIAPEHSDLLAKNAITTLRTPRSYSRAVQWTGPQAVRFGVWNFPESCRFPAEKSWISDFTSMSYQRAVRSAAAGRKALHLAFDTERIAQSRAYHLQSLEYLLASISKYRQSGQLTATTLHGMAAYLEHRPRVRAAHSILRAA
jgi:hypothetical protein